MASVRDAIRLATQAPYGHCDESRIRNSACRPQCSLDTRCSLAGLDLSAHDAAIRVICMKPAGIGYNAPSRSLVLSAAALTARDILGALTLAVVVGSAIDALGAVLPMIVSRGAAVVAGVFVIYNGIRLWGRDIARITGRPKAAGISKYEALTFATVLGLVALALGLAEPLAVRLGARSNLRIDQVYTLLFVPTTLIIASTGAYLLARGHGGAGSAVRLAAQCGLASAAVFLAVDLGMDALGWRVGAPGAGRRATMIVVTTLGMAFAAFAAGGVIGASLSRLSSESR